MNKLSNNWNWKKIGVSNFCHLIGVMLSIPSSGGLVKRSHVLLEQISIRKGNYFSWTLWSLHLKIVWIIFWHKL